MYYIVVENDNMIVGPFPSGDVAAWWKNECEVNGLDALDMVVVGPLRDPNQTRMEWDEQASELLDCQAQERAERRAGC